jgi:hypothetical protein
MGDLSWQQSLFGDTEKEYRVEPIEKQDTHWFMLNLHYAKRIPSVSFAYGLIHNNDLVGVVTYGTPPSSTLCRGICGDQYQNHVVELNRLVLKNNGKNEASRLVGGSIKLLPTPKIVVSFADSAQDHYGYVYQATNFLYTGLSAKFVDPRVKGLEHQHHATYAHGLTNKEVVEKYGSENVYFIERSRKHRYIKFVGDKREIKEMVNALKYEVLPYPKKKSDG